MSDSWREILWYRGFYDVPRLFCVGTQGGHLILESRFDGDLDEYEDVYVVRLAAAQDALAADATDEAFAALPVIGTVAVRIDSFDSTRRTAFRLPSAIGTHALRAE